MTTINEELTAAHPWLSTEKARWILKTRIDTFRDELGMETDAEIGAGLAKAVHVYKNMTEDELRNTIARFEEHHL